MAQITNFLHLHQFVGDLDCRTGASGSGILGVPKPIMVSVNRTFFRRALAVAAYLVVAASVSAQTTPEFADRFVAMTAVTGYEQRMAETLVDWLPFADRDRAGNVVAVIGSGSPVRLAVCPMDERGYIVGRILDDGFLTLRRVGGGGPLFDQGLEGHRVAVWTDGGPVPGVVSIPSTHLGRGRASQPDRPFDVDDAIIDVGADSAADVAALGVRVLDAVALAKRAHRYGESLLAGPEAGRRAGCAALARAASTVASGEVLGTFVIAFVVESYLRHSGLRVVARTHGPFSATWLIDYEVPDRALGEDFGGVERSRLPVRFEATPVETVDLVDADALSDRLIAWAGTQP